MDKAKNLDIVKNFEAKLKNKLNIMGNLPKKIKLLSINEAAKYLGLSTKTLRRWEAAGTLKALRTQGGHRRYSARDLSLIVKKKKADKTKVFAKDIINIPAVKKEDKIVTKYIYPEIDDSIEIYKPISIHPDQKNVLKNLTIAFASFLIFTLVYKTSTPLASIVEKTKENIANSLPVKGLPKTFIASSTNKFATETIATVNANEKNSKVLAAQVGANIPVFNVNITSSFKEVADFVKGLTSLDVNTGTLEATGAARLSSTLNVIGATNLSTLTVTGNISGINGITYTFPTAQGTANTALTNDGTGKLTWGFPISNVSSATGVLGISNGGTNNSSSYSSGSIIFSDGSKLTQNNSNLFWDDSNKRLGLLTTSPSSTLSIGSSSQFQVNSTGNLVKVNGVTYSFPSSQGAASSSLQNDGAGNLSWSSGGSLTGSGTSNQVTYWNGTSSVTGSSSFTWNNTTGILSSTGLSLTLGSDATGDTYYRNSSGNFARLGIGTTGQTLTVSGGLPAWTGGSGTGSSGFWTRTGTTLSPFNTGDNITTTGNLGIGSTTAPTSQLSLNATSASGTIFNMAYGTLTTLTGDLTGSLFDLDSGNVTATNQNVTGLQVKLPTVTNTITTGTKTLTGFQVNFGTGAGINQNGAGGTTTYNALSASLPALTQTAGTLNVNGLYLTTPSSITTGGTASGINISATGVGAGSLNGVNISSITGSTGTETALNVGSGWDSVLTVGSTNVINGSGITQVAGGGTGTGTYTKGDILYSDATNSLTKLGIGTTGYVLTVSAGGIPSWNTISGSSCTNCLINNPTSDQTISPTNDTTGLSIRQTTAVSPTHDIFSVTNSTGLTKYLYVDSSGVVNIPSIGSSASDQLTITPGTDKYALKLVGTNVATNSLQIINPGNTSGTIFSTTYPSAKTLTGSLTGESLDLNTNLTVTNQSVTAQNITLPTFTNTNTTGTKAYYGIKIAPPGGGGINQNGAGGTSTYTLADLTMPALTQTAGTLTSTGVNITTPSSITTGGTAYGINISASGIGAGTLTGLNIGSITAGAGTQTAINIGSGWNNIISGTTAGTNLISFTNFTVTSAGALTATSINDSGLAISSPVYTDASKNLTSTAPTSGAIGYWSRSGTTLSPTTTTDLINLTPNVSTGTGTTAGLYLAANSLTTGNGVDIQSSSLSTGNLVALTSTSTAGNGEKLLNLSSSGANATSTVTNYGLYSTITNTGTSSTNVAGYFSASGGTNNYGLIVNAGYVGIGTTTPTALLQLAAATTARSSLNITSSTGTNVTTPNNGDLWWNGTNLYFYNGTANKDLMAGVTSSGTGLANQIAYFTTDTNITGSSLLKFNPSNTTGIGSSSNFYLSATGTTTGDIISATSSAITTGNILKLGEGGDQAFSGNVIFADIDNTGGGGNAFTGNFELFKNAGTTKWYVDYAGNASASGSFTLGNGQAIKPAYGPLTLDYKSGANAWSAGITLQDTTGNVGILNTNPSKALDVTGDIKLSGKFYDSNVTGGISLGDTSNTALTGFGASSIVGALNELKNSDKNTSHNDYLSWANSYQPVGEGSNTNSNPVPHGLFFDTFADTTKTDSSNTTVSGPIQVSLASATPKPAAPYRAGLIGGQTFNTTNTDNAGNTYLGSNSINKIIYYDRTKDSSPETLVSLGIDPNWYNGVSLSIATTSAQFSQNDTNYSQKANPNLSTSYNGSLIKVTGNYSSNTKTIYITIKSSTTFDWTDYNGNSATAVSMTPGTAQALGSTGVSVNFTNATYNIGDVFRIASWFIEPSGSTRGSKQQFPERSYITAESTAVDIIDADTQKLWMRFSTGTNFALGTSTNDTPISVSILNGQLYVAKNGSSATGLYTINFGNDSMWRHNATNYSLSDTAIYGRNAAVTYNTINTSLALVNATVNDVTTAVVPNQPTGPMTTNGWGYVTTTVATNATNTVNYPYKFVTIPNVQISYAGYAGSTAPKTLADCGNGGSVNVAAQAESIGTNSFTAQISYNSNFSAGTIYCYTWTATGTVAPKQFVAAGTGTSTADGATTIINETDGTKADVSLGSQHADVLWSSKVAIAQDGTLYFAENDTTNPTTSGIFVYYGIHGLQSETSFAQYLNGAYYSSAASNWSSNGPYFLGTGASNEVNSLSVSSGTSTIDGKSNTLYISTLNGLTVLQEKQSRSYQVSNITGDEKNGSVKYYTNNYITEEMLGDTRGMWPMNGSGTIALNANISDASVKATTYTAKSGTAAYATGVRGTGISFNGTSDYFCSGTGGTCSTNSNMGVTGDMSFGAWFKPANTTQAPLAFWKTNGYGITLNNGGGVGAVNKYACAWYDSVGATSRSVTSNTLISTNWTNINCTISGTTMSIYVNGILEGTGTYSGTRAAGTNLGLGGYVDTPGNYYAGTIDELYMTANALSASQIKHMYEVGYRALQSHATTLGGGAADSNQQLGGTTSSVGDAKVDFNNQYLYVGTNDITNGRVSKIDMPSDTNIQTYDKTANTPTGGTLLANDDTKSLAVGYRLEAVASATTGIVSIGYDSYSTATSGTFYSKTQTIASNTKYAYLWLSVVTDPSDVSNTITPYACNAYSTKALCDSNNAWIAGTLIQTNTTSVVPEKEYSFSFTSAGGYLTFKYNIARGSTKTNTYASQYGATWSSSVGGADIAERYNSSEPVFPGQIVTLDTPGIEGVARVKLSRNSYDPKMIGIVTTNPGIVMDNSLVDLNFNAASRNSPDRPAIALSGRVPVKIDPDSEPIRIGDFLTSSDKEGTAKKATKGGYTIAKALESWDKNSDKNQIMVFVNLGYYMGDLTADGYIDTANSLIAKDVKINIDNNTLSKLNLLDVSIPKASDSANASSSASVSISQVIASLAQRIESLETKSLLSDNISASASGNLNNLTVLGNSLLEDTIINGKLNVGGLTFTNTDQSINAIGVLKIQNLSLGNVEFMNGLITLDTKGQITVKTVSADKYKVAGTSAGKATIKAGDTSTTINSDQINDKSLIFITPQSQTNKVLSVGEKTNGQNFKVQIISPETKDIEFNWWIVDNQ